MIVRLTYHWHVGPCIHIKRSCLRQAMERTEESNCVMDFLSAIPLLTYCPSRSHLQPGVKTKNWEDRMKKTQKALSIKKLQAKLGEEKQAELKRLVILNYIYACFLIFSSSRRREVTAERKRAAEEKRRLEEAKAQVRAFIVPYSLLILPRWEHAKLQGCVVEQAERKRLTIKITDVTSTCVLYFQNTLKCAQ